MTNHTVSYSFFFFLRAMCNLTFTANLWKVNQLKLFAPSYLKLSTDKTILFNLVKVSICVPRTKSAIDAAAVDFCFQSAEHHSTENILF